MLRAPAGGQGAGGGGCLFGDAIEHGHQLPALQGHLVQLVQKPRPPGWGNMQTPPLFVTSGAGCNTWHDASRFERVSNETTSLAMLLQSYGWMYVVPRKAEHAL